MSDKKTELEKNLRFEADVRRVAEAIWGMRPGECQPQHYTNNPKIRELDGLIRLRDITHLIMVTTSTKIKKVKEDIAKLNEAEKLEKDIQTTISKWLITEKQLDAEHIRYAKKNDVKALTLEQFQARFFNGTLYITKRRNAPFGSARDPLDESKTINPDRYEQLPIVIEEQNISKSKNKPTTTTKDTTIDEIILKLMEGEHVALLAPFGAGKSITTWKIFDTIAEKYHQQKTSKIPIAINLREHWKQDDFDEILERHAKRIGYSPKEDLVAGWRAGLGILLLDGFDEVASQSIVRQDDRHFMQEARRNALIGVKSIFANAPDGLGIFICGRDHYFDDPMELKKNFGIIDRKINIMRLGEFTEAKATQFLHKIGVDKPLPDWLPRKPLLLSFIASKNLLSEILEIDQQHGYGYVWDQFIDRICERESALEKSEIDPQTIRRVMELLSCIVRTTATGTGPITGNDLSTTFRNVTGQNANDAVLAQLQRLPGLTERDQTPGCRSFLDEDIMSALQGGSIARYILGEEIIPDIQLINPLNPNAISVAAHIITSSNNNHNIAISKAERLSKSTVKRPLHNAAPQITADCAQIAIEICKQNDVDSIDFKGVNISEATIETFNMEEFKIDNITFSDCNFLQIIANEFSFSGNITFIDCEIDLLSAPYSSKIDSVFKNCNIHKKDQAATNNAILQLDIPNGLKALLTILRKIYLQPGSGRKLTALKRGLPNNDIQTMIPKIVSLLQKHEFVTVHNKIAHPIRKRSSIVREIVNAPLSFEHPLLNEVKNL